VRRILPTALAAAVLVAAFTGVASARLAGDADDAGPAPAPFAAPATLPGEDSAHPGSYGFRTSDAIASRYDTSAPSTPAASGGSATVTVTATVLPVVFIVFDEDGTVAKLVTNSPERDARGVLYLPRAGSETGTSVELDADAWAAARAALAAAHEGTGTIWSA
jgi:hypothetical protein